MAPPCEPGSKVYVEGFFSSGDGKQLSRFDLFIVCLLLVSSYCGVRTMETAAWYVRKDGRFSGISGRQLISLHLEAHIHQHASDVSGPALSMIPILLQWDTLPLDLSARDASIAITGNGSIYMMRDLCLGLFLCTALAHDFSLKSLTIVSLWFVVTSWLEDGYTIITLTRTGKPSLFPEILRADISDIGHVETPLILVGYYAKETLVNTLRGAHLLWMGRSIYAVVLTKVSCGMQTVAGYGLTGGIYETESYMLVQAPASDLRDVLR
ncbi:uncharacterized protein EV420DRAFT_1653978 [Desarmillaria tabescens]|uniref:Uncharacterized protein n=1 Tax=Armillaria tabescens TaxID=1929756 RepID=A0AA39J2U2_ARMTA|nr:uncharacterized protein EV420DRAFT_1653978 [Desarmillaria tabescens]KAK0434519.1 hypothetical protein EV420DRAFT_1653978 [Desarmillaria tabescens]